MNEMTGNYVSLLPLIYNITPMDETTVKIEYNGKSIVASCHENEKYWQIDDKKIAYETFDESLYPILVASTMEALDGIKRL